MSIDLGSAHGKIIIDGSQVKSGVGEAQGALSKLGGTAAKMGAVIAGAMAVAGGAMVAAGVKAISLGADANETASLLETSLGPATEGLNDRLREFAENANRSFFELQTGASTFVAMTKAMGATEEQSADLSGNFVEMATDLGSFFNVSTDQALADLQGALAGSSETMQKYGVDVRETTLKQMALDQGLIETASETIPRLDRAMLIQQAIMEQSADAMGDAERTSDSWQNTLRGLRGRLTDMATEIGQKLIPALTPLLNKLMEFVQLGIDRLMPMIDELINFIEGFFSALEEGQDPVQAAIDSFLTWTETGENLSASAFNIVMQISNLWEKIKAGAEPIIAAIGNFVEWKDVLIAAGIAVGLFLAPLIIAAAKIALIAAALVAAVALIRNAWESNWLGIRDAVLNAWNNFIRPAFEQLVAWLQVNVPIAIEALKQFWENTLKPALQEIGNFIKNEVVPAIQELAAWLGENIPIAIEAVKQFWEDTLKPALEAIWSFITDTVIPAISAFAASLSEGVTAAFEAVKNFWEGTLKPALEALWGFIEDNILPVIGSFIGVVTELAEVAFNLVAAVWENVLKPALDALWAIIKENVTPAVEDAQGVMEDIADFLRATLGPVVNTLVDGALSAMRGAIDGITSALRTVKGWLDTFKATLSDLEDKLPSWLRRKSPSEIELTLQGVSERAKEAAEAFKEFGAAISGAGGGGETSPLSLLDTLQAIGQELRNLGERLVEAGHGFEGLIDIAGGLSSIGSAIGSIFKAREIDPLEQRLDDINKTLDETSDNINEFFEEKGFEDFDILELTPQERLQKYFEILREGNTEMANDILRIDTLLSRQRSTTEELTQAEQELLNIQKQQQDLQLLQAQQKLLDLIAEHDLSTALLSGLEFGLDADLSQILQAMSFAMQEIIAQAEEELGVSSPSKVFEKIGRAIPEGLVRGLTRMQGEVEGAIAGLVAPRPQFFQDASRTATFAIDASGQGVMQQNAISRAVRKALDDAGLEVDERRRT